MTPMLAAPSQLAFWSPEGSRPPLFFPAEFAAASEQFRHPVVVLRELSSGHIGLGWGGRLHNSPAGKETYQLLATLPALYPEWLGDRTFAETHHVRFPYIAGEMANGIATTQMVIAMARAGMLGFFGAAGLAAPRVAAALDELQATLDPEGLSWGINLIHSPAEPILEEKVAEMFIQRGVARVCASAYMSLTLPLVQYACSGLHVDEMGAIQRKHYVFAKISRAEVAQLFMSPAPAAMLQKLVQAGKLTATEAELAARVPLAEDITVEADSGGHTDQQALGAIFPTILSLRDRLVAEHQYPRPIRVGAAGGLGTPTAVAAAFAMGAAYILTGSVNQACVESGLHESGRRMLAQAGVADVAMVPAADMFEIGVKLQVLKKGTMYPSRSGKLYEIYKQYDSLAQLPAELKQRLEREIFTPSLEAWWEATREFWLERDPSQIEQAARDPKHQMALVFRAYLGLASRWAITGEANRQLDYQIWCGPAMGAFNDWTRGTFLAAPENRSVVQVARNLLEGAAVITRAGQLRSFGVPVPPAAFQFIPRPLN
ncbi:MAG TPA: PfaD family polyunsaturated fatty acid/polyketide biosynthesis protein [Blastocatellia bacterium]|nr:PfaD family polyunsaturated fatty acid/polyketide biosynthesis protein [Blastocatellia bacterium]